MDCTDGQGARVYWETAPDIGDDGSVNSEHLYRDIAVSINNVEVRFAPESVQTKLAQIFLRASSKDGQYVSVTALKLIKDEGDSRTYSGTMQFSVKSPDGKIKRSKGTKATCTLTGEA
jgi:hypothetical protein